MELDDNGSGQRRLSRQRPRSTATVPAVVADDGDGVVRADSMLNVYRRTDAYDRLERKVSLPVVKWNVGVGTTASFTRAIASIAVEGTIRRYGPFDPVIKVELMKEPTEEAAALSRSIRLAEMTRRQEWVMKKMEYQLRAAFAKELAEEEIRRGSGSHISIEYQLRAAAAKELGLLDQEEYIRRKEADDELRYYSYGMHNSTGRLNDLVLGTRVPQIHEKLSTKKYLLVVDNLYKHIESSSFSEKVGLPHTSWSQSNWLITTTSREVCDRSKSEGHGVLQFSSEEEILMLILSALHQSANYIFNTIRWEDEQYWHRVALRCLHSAMLLFPQHPLLPDGDIIHGDGHHQSILSSAPSVTSDELIRQWAAQGILASIEPRVQESIKEETGSYGDKYDDIYQVGNVILKAFQEYSLMKLRFSLATEADAPTETAAQFLASHGLSAESLPTVDKLFDEMQLPFSLATKADAPTETAAQFLASHGLSAERLPTVDKLFDEMQLPFSLATKAAAPTETAAQFLASHGLIAERLPTVDKLFDEMQWLEHKKWISLVDNKGCHITSEWLSNETGGPTTLILRHCSQISNLFSQLDHLLPNLPCLCVLDLSYTTLESLPPSIWCLLNLRLLSLRGCRGLKSVCSFSDSERSDSSKNSNKNTNLLYLDLSYSDINTFHCDFFQNMPNLQELLLVKCSNLVELPPSIVALSSLTTLELTGTQIKSFSEEIFREMYKLQSFKLIGNKKLVLLPGSISKAHGLIKLHIEGWKSSIEEEIKLDGHPTLQSFSLISAPHVRCLSLGGCRKLESVEFKDLGALEDLNLSATAIKELPADICNLPQLRRLLLMGVPSLRRFPWHKLRRLPKVFCLDQCAEGIGNHFDQVAQVCISDSRLFHSFNDTARDLVRNGRFFQSFYVRVAPCIASIRSMQDEDMVAKKLQELAQKKSPYADVYCHYMAEGANCMVSMVTPPIRQTERHVEISAMDRHPDGLKYLLQVTKSITVTDDTFVSCLHDLSDFNELEECKLRQCHQMEKVFNSKDYHALKHLKHLHLEYCPILEDIMLRGALPSLTTLDILFCYNLKTIFYSASSELPGLQRIRLQELPQLKHLRDDDAIVAAPMWKELHVRGCWSLHRLPRLRQEQPSKVEVSGERAWWAKLRWGTPPHRDSYKPKLSPAFASFDERAEVKSYLR